MTSCLTNRPGANLCAVVGTSLALISALAPAVARGDAKSIVEVKATVLRDRPTAPVTGGSAHVAIIGATHARYIEVPAYTSVDQKLSVVVKQYDKVSLKLIDWPEDEFMYLLAGTVRIVDVAGRGRTYGPGDAIVVPKGFSGTWEQRSRIKMYTVSYTAQP